MRTFAVEVELVADRRAGPGAATDRGKYAGRRLPCQPRRDVLAARSAARRGGRARSSAAPRRLGRGVQPPAVAGTRLRLSRAAAPWSGRIVATVRACGSR